MTQAGAGAARPLTGRLLLVEDETAVRELLRDTLRRAGFDVLEAGDPRDAVALFERRADEIDLLITDLTMPDMNGRQLATRLRARRPGLRVIYVSGYTEETGIASGAPGDGARFLQKPFPPAALVRAVRDLLGSG